MIDVKICRDAVREVALHNYEFSWRRRESSRIKIPRHSNWIVLCLETVLFIRRMRSHANSSSPNASLCHSGPEPCPFYIITFARPSLDLYQNQSHFNHFQITPMNRRKKKDEKGLTMVALAFTMPDFSPWQTKRGSPKQPPRRRGGWVCPCNNTTQRIRGKWSKVRGVFLLLALGISVTIKHPSGYTKKGGAQEIRTET